MCFIDYRMMFFVGCRPEKITCRWLKEITLSLAKQEHRIKPIEQCESNLDQQWKTWIQSNEEPMKNCEMCMKILNFEVDYNEV